MNRPLVRAAFLLALAARPAFAVLPSPSVERADAAVKAGRRDEAFKLLKEARKLPQNEEDRERIALLYQGLKDFTVSEALLGDLIKEHPEEPRLRLYLACVIAMAGDRESSLMTLAEAAKLKPDAVTRQRMAFLHQDLKDYPPARALLDGLIQEAPRDLSVRLDRASLAAQSGEKSEALKQLAAAAELNPGPDDKRRMAAMYRDIKEFAKAKVLLEKVPEDAHALYDRATLAERAGRREEAIVALAAALKLSPPLDDRRRIAALYLDLGAYDEDAALVDSLVKEAPEDPSVRLDRAALEVKRGDRTAALAAIAEGLARTPDLQDRQRAALLSEDIKEYKQAREILDGLLKEEPRDPQLHIDLALFASDTGDRKTALAALAEARRLKADPDDRRRMSELYERLKSFDEAKAVLREAK